jgi:hypothetical protein
MSFDDGWDEQETALFLAINEEMREEARWWAQQQDAEDHPFDPMDDDESLQFGYGGGFGGRPLRPFEQYVQDYLNGKKGLDDPLYGPGRKSRQDDSFDTTTTILGVRIQDAHLVSEKLLAVLAHVLTAVKEISIARIVFDSSGGPAVDGRPVHGTFDAGLREVRINLRSLWQMAARIASMQRNHLRLDALVWHGTLEVLLHECFHAMPPQEGISPEIQFCDEHATFWAQNMVVALARDIDVEPPDVHTDPFFGPRIVDFLNKDNQSSGFQRRLFDAGMVYRNDAVGAEIRGMKTYYAVLAGDDCGIPQQDELRHILHLEAQYFDELNRRTPFEAAIPTESGSDPAFEKQGSDTSLEFYLHMAAELLKNERNADDRRALEYTERALKIAPANIDALLNRGLAAGRLGMSDKAINSYTLAAQYEPMNDQPHEAMGYLHTKARNYPQALQSFTRAIECNPKNFLAFNNRAVAWFQLGEFDNAMADAQRCVDLGGPDDFYRYLMRMA